MSIEKLLFKPEEVAEALSIGRSEVYEPIGTGELASVRIGTSRRVPTDALVEFVTRLRNPAAESVAGSRG